MWSAATHVTFIVWIFFADLDFNGSRAVYNATRRAAWHALGDDGKQVYRDQARRINGNGEPLTEEDKIIHIQFNKDLIKHAVSTLYGLNKDLGHLHYKLQNYLFVTL